MFLAMVWHARRRLTVMSEIERVSEANLQLLERERRFVQDASHELRTPITVALGHIELIERTATDPELREDAEVAVEELLRLRSLAERDRKSTRLNSSHVAISYAVFCLKKKIVFDVDWRAEENGAVVGIYVSFA